MLSKEVLQEIEIAAHELRVEPAALAAVAHIESGMRVQVLVDERREPLIRFEGHYFDRRLAGAKRERARREGLASPEAGAVANPPSQAERWAMLRRAAAIDTDAAYESTSWGIGQVMGAHWAWLGYASVAALAAEARDGLGGQLRLMTRYVDKAGLAGALRGRDWAAFARGYNGPAYRRNCYDTKLARAHARYAQHFDTSSLDVLRLGARGDAVRDLQEALVEQGHDIAVDGLFGPATERAVRRFQHGHGLEIDGVAGSQTLAVLRAATRPMSIQSWFARILRRVRLRAARLTRAEPSR